ncbi:peptidoglycan bridge formation glycyltransferase FemA/FemB family protein [Bifidobacterium jacchi]|uniref:Aminoacyltransferase n=1 Tax=Bifidobacterium jacchi TaxID=2490545 RepID=A0A5N5RL89_9BIFI|nr:peptidoglycan bridge formation glycyltransferase FemA/FemB family protein [Bifidobacterium jacchi]KAB5608058.1 aminoacyltransferase [Bifidobacterium jacchi]
MNSADRGREGRGGYSFGPISGDELIAFSRGDDCPQGCWQQDAGQIRLARMRGHETECLGVRDAAGRLVCACVIIYLKGRFGMDGSVYYAPLTAVIDGRDYGEDDAVIAAMTSAIRASAKRHHAISVSIWPNVPHRLYDAQGRPTGEANERIVTAYQRAGWVHDGYHTGYDLVCQWSFVKDLTGITDGASLMASYGKRGQWSVKRSQSMGVRVREIGEDEFDVFSRIESDTAARRGFTTRDEAYFHQFKKAYGDDAHFMLAEIHVDEYKADMTAKRDALAERVAQLQARYDARPTTRIERQLGEDRRNLAAADKRLNEAATLFAGKGDVVPAAVSLFVSHPHEVIYQYSGSVEQYKPFYAPALIQYEAMLHLCVEQGVARYSFGGISGVFDDPHDEGRGVLEFKQGFNGYAEELVGKFTLETNPFMCAIQRFAHRLLGR